MNSHERLVLAQNYTPSIDESLQLYNRGLVGETAFTKMLKKGCGGDGAFAEAWKEMRFQIPGPSDLIRFAVREAFDPATIQQYDYHKEFPSTIIPWMDKQGFGQQIGIPIPAGGTDNNNRERVGNATWSDLYWWSHWELPSTGQGYEMVHRLYPNSRYGPSPDVRNGISFNEEDLAKLQKANDIPQYWRDRLTAISYQPLTRVDVQRMYLLNVLNREQVYHSFRAGGYNDENAENMTRFVDRLKAKSMGLDPSKAALGWVEKNYKRGLISDTQASERLATLGFPLEYHAAYLAKLRLDVKNAKNEAFIKAIKRDYMLGIINEEGARTAWAEFGANAEVVRDIVDTWSYEKIAGKKFLAANKNIALFLDGIITQNELVARLQNLNYDSIDITRMVSQARFKGISNRQKAIAAEIKRINTENSKRALEIAKQQKALQAEANKQQRELQKQYKDKVDAILAASTDKNLKEWFKLGLLTVKDVFVRLYLKGWAVYDIRSWFKATNKEITDEMLNAAEKEAKDEQRKLKDQKPNETKPG
jgi:hypothetical protein